MNTKSPGFIPDDEIDIGVLGRKAFGILAYPFRLLSQNLLISLSFALCAVIAAVGLKYLSPRVYRSSFIIRPTDRTEKFHLRIIGDLESLRREKNYAELARQLKLGIIFLPAQTFQVADDAEVE